MAEQNRSHAPTHCKECGKSFPSEDERREHAQQCEGARGAHPTQPTTQEQNKTTSKE